MALPTSGPLTLANIQTEFGGSNPISLSEYYAGGAYVPAGTSGTYGAVPSSGAISIRNFYGTSNVTIAFGDQNIYGADFGSAQAGYWIIGTGGSLSAGSAYQYLNSGAATFLEQWITPTTGAAGYEVYATATGATLSNGTLGSWVSTSSNPAWDISAFGSGTSLSTTLSLQIRKTGTTTVLDTWTVILTADAF